MQKTFFKDKKFHFIGIGGVGMSALAQFVLAHGGTVTGSDMTFGAYCGKLAKQGCQIFVGHNAENVGEAQFVVTNSAISKDNCEVVEAMNRGLKILRREQLLGQIFNSFDQSISVCGMHGKTSTTAMLTHVLLPHNPTAFIGGDYDGKNFLLGKGDVCVAEACEYKGSFLELFPLVNCILNIDQDHLDFFQDEKHIVNTFIEYATHTRKGGFNVVCGDNRLLSGFGGVTFGLGSHNIATAANIRHSAGKYSFDFVFDGVNLGRVKLEVFGKHNVLNALCTLTVVKLLGFDVADAMDRIRSYFGVDRRFSRHTKQLCDVIVDYAHHPAEIATLLDTVKELNYKKVHLVFQPHTYTRTKALFDEFEKVLSAHHVYIFKTYAAREEKISGASGIDLFRKIRLRQKCSYSSTPASLVKKLKQNCSFGDVILLVGAGDINQVEKLID